MFNEGIKIFIYLFKKITLGSNYKEKETSQTLTLSLREASEGGDRRSAKASRVEVLAVGALEGNLSSGENHSWLELLGKLPSL